jgi:hypothetical protein
MSGNTQKMAAPDIDDMEGKIAYTFEPSADTVTA